jgi:hypothetical protein
MLRVTTRSALAALIGNVCPIYQRSDRRRSPQQDASFPVSPSPIPRPRQTTRSRVTLASAIVSNGGAKDGSQSSLAKSIALSGANANQPSTPRERGFSKRESFRFSDKTTTSIVGAVSASAPFASI